MKIAVIAACPFPWPRGTPLRTFRLAEALVKRGHEVHAITYHLGEDSESPFPIHRIENVSSYQKTSPGPSLRKLFKLNPALTRLTRILHQEIRFDVVHAVHYEGMMVAKSAVQDAPLVYDAHTTLAGELPDYFPGLLKPLLRAIGSKLDRSIPSAASHIVSVSETITKTLIRNGAVNPANIDTIANGVNYHLFTSEAPIEPDPKRIVFTGNDAPYQRLDLLLDGFAIALQTVPSLRLSIAGSASFESAKKRVKELKIGYATEVLDIPFDKQIDQLARASIAVTPRTVCDGLPQKLLNYMAAGKAIVACKGSSGPIENGVTGLTIPNDDPKAMAEAMLTLANDPKLAKSLGLAASLKAKSEYSWDAAAERIEEIYMRLLSEADQQPNSL
ncbi:glycosyltransferase family 4 protein [Pelagicoccus sp. SDUM812002]|uniref:glycosyltransferase family 4 protein n=1 Tax=Pelagicoccus sp. SDUM812002 TaxID=3041266 RepID=UPI00280FC417|nr:glycosyltransferase family 4 protein [Pelagicoccus sp. SDUM812002]MDQ8186835.1 glycosyltransferase family 4 protein [Pelagicoccus sp. SDUM812002]